MQHESALANKLLHSLPRLFHFQKLLLQQPAVNYVEFRLCTRQRNARPKAAGNKQPAREGGRPAIRIGREAVQRTQWHPNVPMSANGDGKFWWRDADDGERDVVDVDGLTDDRRAGVKPAPQVPIAS